MKHFILLNSFNNQIGSKDSKEEWVSKLKELYHFVSIHVDSNKKNDG